MIINEALFIKNRYFSQLQKNLIKQVSEQEKSKSSN